MKDVTDDIEIPVSIPPDLPSIPAEGASTLQEEQAESEANEEENQQSETGGATGGTSGLTWNTTEEDQAVIEAAREVVSQQNADEAAKEAAAAAAAAAAAQGSGGSSTGAILATMEAFEDSTMFDGDGSYDQDEDQTTATWVATTGTTGGAVGYVAAGTDDVDTNLENSDEDPVVVIDSDDL
jgi:hypothetical protein